jgi:predicted AAA+ superfamily ATPase
MATIGRFFDDPGVSFFLFGPRGTGKSTWLRAHHASALWLDLLAPEVFRTYAARPERLRELLAAHPEAEVVVIDEVQKVPGLLEVVHEQIEANRRVRFVLTGSSARKLRRAGVNLLAGRAVLRHLHPFLAAELGEAFDLARALRQGLLPIVWDAERPDDVLRAYVALYLREEVQQEAMVRDLGTFARFLEVSTFSHGAILNLSELAREAEVSRKTVEGYLAVLEDLLLPQRQLFLCTDDNWICARLFSDSGLRFLGPPRQ